MSFSLALFCCLQDFPGFFLFSLFTCFSLFSSPSSQAPSSEFSFSRVSLRLRVFRVSESRFFLFRVPLCRVGPGPQALQARFYNIKVYCVSLFYVNDIGSTGLATSSLIGCPSEHWRGLGVTSYGPGRDLDSTALASPGTGLHVPFGHHWHRSSSVPAWASGTVTVRG